MSQTKRNRCVLIDAGVLGMISNPGGAAVNLRSKRWMSGLILRGVLVKVPSVSDYEVRRELVRKKAKASLSRLDAMIAQAGGVLTLSDDVMLEAAELWAEARRRGRQTASDQRLDADMIMCAHSRVLAEQGYVVEIATTNTKHLSAFVVAKQWYSIK